MSAPPLSCRSDPGDEPAASCGAAGPGDAIRDRAAGAGAVGYTPGPWIVDPANDHLVARDDGGLFRYVAIAQHPIIRWSADVCEANARLIATAPDLLAALRPLAQMATQMDGVADWRGNGRRPDSFVICNGYRPITLGEARAARAAISRATGGV